MLPPLLLVLVITCIFCTLSRTPVIAYETTENNPMEGDRAARHIVFFGDSLIRYQYLAYVYKLHFHTEIVPEYLINEKMFLNWNDFFENSTSLFNGAMTCDCYRSPSVKRLSSARENRRYTYPSGGLVVSYFPLMGYFPIQGMNQSAIKTSFGQKRTNPDWLYSTPYSFVEKHLARVNPTPDVVFVNSGHWNNKNIARNPRVLLEILEKVVLSHRSIVMDGSGTVEQLKQKQKRYEEEEDVGNAGKCVAWLATTKPNIGWWTGARDADWSIMRGHYCQKSLSTSPTSQEEGHASSLPTSSSSSKPSVPADDSLMMKACVFVPFNGKGVKKTDYFDHMHFSNETIYHVRTSMALQACNLQNSVYTS